jgi:hypothetical protein
MIFSSVMAGVCSRAYAARYSRAGSTDLASITLRPWPGLPGEHAQGVGLCDGNVDALQVADRLVHVCQEAGQAPAGRSERLDRVQAASSIPPEELSPPDPAITAVGVPTARRVPGSRQLPFASKSPMG